MQTEAIYFPGYSFKITNHNIQITITNDQNAMGKYVTFEKMRH